MPSSDQGIYPKQTHGGVICISIFFKKKMKFLFIWMNKIFTENSPLKKPNPLDEISKNK